MVVHRSSVVKILTGAFEVLPGWLRRHRTGMVRPVPHGRRQPGDDVAIIGWVGMAALQGAAPATSSRWSRWNGNVIRLTKFGAYVYPDINAALIGIQVTWLMAQKGDHLRRQARWRRRRQPYLTMRPGAAPAC